LLGGKSEQPRRLHGVLGDTFTVIINDPKIGLSARMALFSCKVVPSHRFYAVLRNTFIVGVHDAEDRLGECVTLVAYG